MSIINKMHQELKEHQDSAPILATMPSEQPKKRVLLFVLISLLLLSSIGLSYLIYEQQESPAHQLASEDATARNPVAVNSTSQDTAQENATLVANPSDSPSLSIDARQVKLVPATTQANIEPKQQRAPQKARTQTVATPVTRTVSTKVQPKQVVAPEGAKSSTAPTRQQAPTTGQVATLSPVVDKQPIVEKTAPASPKTQPVASKTQPAASISKAPVAKNSPASGHLEIKKSQLTASQLANIHLKKAQKAMQRGDFYEAASARLKALNLQPQLHEVRDTLARYYYDRGDSARAKSLLQQGAVEFPEQSEFNLMLARIALQEEQPQKAYLYLQQSPPDVVGHLDYHVNYAVLAQKFGQYEQSETLYMGLLTQRPNNGRWRMALAIAQDKQGKQRLAVASYQKALLQVDLSRNAKQYINQRLTYLATQ